MTSPGAPPARDRTVVADGLPELDQRLSRELDACNAAATGPVAPARELTVQVLDASGQLAAGLSGWTWGVAAGIGMTWVREGSRGDGLGGGPLRSFEDEARVHPRVRQVHLRKEL